LNLTESSIVRIGASKPRPGEGVSRYRTYQYIRIEQDDFYAEYGGAKDRPCQKFNADPQGFF
jgi:hypothetical protein